MNARILTICLLVNIGLLTAQQATKKVSLLWDSSYSMIQKDVDREMEFLKSYFNRNPEVDLNVKVFSNTVASEQRFNIRNGNWQDLRAFLDEVIYDGSANYMGLLERGVDEILLVTDGQAVADELPNYFPVPVFVISSVPGANKNDLRDLALSSGGTLFQIDSQAEGGITVFGDSDLGADLVQVNTSPGTMVGDEQQLGQVVIAAKRESVELVNTGNLKQDKRKLGYAIESISEEDIWEQDITIEQAVQGQFSNIELKGDQNLSQFISRGKNMTILGDQTGLIVIDGVPVESSVEALSGVNAPTNGPASTIDKTILNNVSAFDPQNVASITVLKGLAATNKYGTLGRNGVILITTKTGSFSGTQEKAGPKILGTTATYSGDELTEASLPDTPYMSALFGSVDVNQAYQVYLDQRARYGASPDFFLNVASYFDNWNNDQLVERVLSNVRELPLADTEVLMALAYKYDEFGLQQQALQTYQYILDLKGNDLQHYRNLALAQVRAGEVNKALILYDRMNKGHFDPIVGYSGLETSLTTEFRNLVATNRGRLNTSYVPEKFKQNVRYHTRVVFEWNHFDAAFDLQIINPQKRYFTWTHSKASDPGRYAREQEQGFGMEEFYMTADDKGEWTFNLDYLGREKEANTRPTYLKVTTYRNYGMPGQTESVKVITLDEINRNENVLKVTI